jgi:hypothetical protein
MEEFDDMLQRTFANDSPENRFEFREEYWLQAAALIEADERRRRRVAWWWRMGIGVGLVLLLGGGVWCWLWPSAPKVGSTPLESLPMLPAAPSIPTAPVADVLPSASESAPSLAAPTLPITASTRSDTRRDVVSTILKEKNTSKKQVLNTATQAADPSGSTVGSGSPKSTQSTAQTFQNQTITSDTPRVAAPENSVATAPVVPTRWADLGLLPTPLSAPTTDSKQVPNLPKIDFPTSPTVPTQISREPSWCWGVVAGASIPSGRSLDQKLGYRVGIFTQKKLSPCWVLGAELAVRARRGDYVGVPPTDSVGSTSINSDGFQVTRTYGFGYVEQQERHVLRSAYWLELPVYATWSARPRWSLQAGVSPALQVLAAGEREVRQSSSLEPPFRVISDQRTLGSGTDGLRRYSLGLMAGTEWAATRRLSVGVRGHWLRRELAQSAEVLASLSSALWADVQVRFLLF